MKRFSALGAFTLVVSVIVAGVVGACGGGGDTGGSAGAGGGFGGKNNPVGGGGNGGSVSTFVGSGGGNQQGLAVSPSARQTIDVTMGKMTPTVKYTATKDGGPVRADWSTDRADIGTVAGGPASDVTFTPSGASGGVVTVSATVGGKSASGSVLVKLSAKQNGPNDSDGEKKQMGTDVKSGGGIGGVGGEGLGTKVTDPSTLTALDHPSSPTSKSLVFLYPYDKTVWPRGMLAPLLQWDSTLGDADAIKIEMSTTSGSFSYSGTFGRPAILGNGPFIHHPVPQDMWDAATSSAGGILPGNKPDELTVKLTVAKGGMAYGPITETYKVAPAKLTGTVYYNSYGTQYVKNWDHDTAGNQVGAAILGIRSGDIAPTLVLGLNSADHSGCRVCHVVASKGRWIIAQAEVPNDGTSRLYDLKAADIQASGFVPMTPDGKYAWAAMTGDGSYALSNSINPSSTNTAMVDSQSTFYKFGPAPVAQGAIGTVPGLGDSISAGYPSYSPDDKMIAYVDASGSTTNIRGPINVADYDNATHGFSNLKKVLDAPTNTRIGYPVFLPDNSGLVFETQVRTSQQDTVMVTRSGTRSELWWVNLKGTTKATRLDSINGLDGTGKLYLPKGPNNHGASAGPKSDHQSSYSESGLDDSTLSYEPTVLPVVAGGYAWVVFTSRRMYGNELQNPPWDSWPTDYDSTLLENAPTKKLWVAAIDLNADPGTDIGHPAFYLPAQELLAGNSRGFWVLDPCRADGTSCDSGDECCNGFCEPGAGGKLVCSPPMGQCSAPQEKCSTASDCCDSSNKCINGFCAVNVPK